MSRSPRPVKGSTTAPPPVKRLRSIDEAADYLGVNARTIRRYLAEGRLPGYRVGGKLLRVNMADVEALAVPVAPHEVSA
ncbi:helix-turn-helix domain-containing protein [Nocardioides sp. 31GB23]|uniref:helix-turn-helix domain-containing protein n=1 Tax=Nocardioides sp. 31GB23 TaxID=3156065 RepID=UPI0032AE8772